MEREFVIVMIDGICQVLCLGILDVYDSGFQEVANKPLEERNCKMDYWEKGNRTGTFRISGFDIQMENYLNPQRMLFYKKIKREGEK